MGNIQVYFDESRAEFKGFNAYYTKTISPFLVRKEGERIERVTKAKKIGNIVGGVILAIAAFLYFRTGSVVAGLLVGALAVLVKFVTPAAMLSKIKGETKEFLIGKICSFLGWSFTVKDFEDPDLEIWQKNRLLPSYDRSNFEDEMRGQSHGANFILCEAHLETQHTDSDGDTNWRTAFRGILLVINFHTKFEGRTVVLRDAGIFNFKKKAGMKRVGLADPVFEKIFEAYSTDQVEARYLLTPTFMQRLVDLETSVKGKRIHFGFIDEKLHIAIEAPNQFETGSMFKPLVNHERVETILKELSSVLDIIDGVIKPLEKRRKY